MFTSGDLLGVGPVQADTGEAGALQGKSILSFENQGDRYRTYLVFFKRLINSILPSLLKLLIF